nr:hypothetical protein [Tanacetum cinerariifolium]
MRTMASAIIYLANNKKFNFSKYIFDNMVKNLEAEVFANMKREGKSFSGIITPLFDTMMVQASKDIGESSETSQAAKIKKLKKRVKKLEGKKKKRNNGLKRMYKFGLSDGIISSDEEGLGDQKDASKQGRIAEIDADEDLSLINKTAQDQGG